jgi:hypothetical protein
MISISKTNSARYCELVSVRFQTLWLMLWNFHLNQIAHTFFGFLPLEFWSISCARIVHRSLAYLCLPYRLNSLGRSLEPNDQDLHKDDYRIDVEPTIRLVFSQTPTRKQHDGHCMAYLSSRIFHIGFWTCRQSISNILFHCRKLLSFLYQLSPKIVRCLSRYTVVAFQTSSLMCQAPVVRATRGTSLW